jgi:hypothetical protein
MAESKIEKVCKQFLPSNAPTFSKVANFYAPFRTCYSTVPPPSDEKRDGKWNNRTCPNCQYSRTCESRSKKKESLKRKEPADGPSSSSISQNVLLHHLQQQQQQQQQLLLVIAQLQQQQQLQHQQFAYPRPKPVKYVYLFIIY